MLCDSTLSVYINLYYTYSSCDAYNMGVKDYLKEEIQGTYSDYTDDQVKRKLLHNLWYY